LDTVEHALDRAVAGFYEKGVTQDDLDRAKVAVEADRIFQSDSQMMLARRYGEAIALGRTTADIDALPRRLGQSASTILSASPVCFSFPNARSPAC
jgi:zinc protease